MSQQTLEGSGEELKALAEHAGDMKVAPATGLRARHPHISPKDALRERHMSKECFGPDVIEAARRIVDWHEDHAVKRGGSVSMIVAYPMKADLLVARALLRATQGASPLPSTAEAVLGDLVRMSGDDRNSVLEPCPFCGSDVELVFSGDTAELGWLICTNASSPCRDSGLLIAFDPTKDTAKAIAAWNRRSLRTPAEPVLPGAEGVGTPSSSLSREQAGVREALEKILAWAHHQNTDAAADDWPDAMVLIEGTARYALSSFTGGKTASVSQPTPCGCTYAPDELKR